jgi:hypothetical protein
MGVAGALGYDFAGVLVEGADLGDAVYGFLDLGVGFEQHLEALWIAMSEKGSSRGWTTWIIRLHKERDVSGAF